MQFTKIDEYLAVSRITGPHHNLLMVRISSGEQGPVQCECLPPVGSCTHEPLVESELIRSVIEGVSEANGRFGRNHCVTHVRYVKNDIGPETVYGFLALKIIEHIESGGEFKKSAKS